MDGPRRFKNWRSKPCDLVGMRTSCDANSAVEQRRAQYSILTANDTVVAVAHSFPAIFENILRAGQRPTHGCGRSGSPGAVGLVGNGLTRRDTLPIRLTGHDHRMAALLCGLSGKLHFLMRAVSSITLTCSRAVT